ncbi:MAG: DUF3562 domain-containing protein [Thermodesulfovibrionales bacterium]
MDRKQHSRAIQMLAKDLRISEEKIQILYEEMLCSLREKARIKEYLVILVSRNVREMIKGNNNNNSSFSY